MRWMANTEVLPVAPVVDATLGRAKSAPRGHDGVFLHCETVKLLGGPSKAPPYLTVIV